MMVKASGKAPHDKAKATRGKRHYISPRLIEYGAITKLTAINGSVLPMDSATGFMMSTPPCL
jgi:hypothetical protein